MSIENRFLYLYDTISLEFVWKSPKLGSCPPTEIKNRSSIFPNVYISKRRSSRVVEKTYSCVIKLAEALKIFFGDPDLGEQDVDQPEFTKGRGAGNGETWEHGCEPGSVGKNILAMLNPSTPEFFLARNWGAGREQEGEGSHARASADVGRTWSRGADRGIIYINSCHFSTAL